MQIAIRKKKENVPLGRTEIECDIAFEKALPSRKEIREALCAAIGASPELLVIVSSKAKFGSKQGVVIAHIYKDKESLKVERKHLLVRDGLAEKPKKDASKK